MALPAITYTPPGLGRQTIPGSEWPEHAAVYALYCAQNNFPLGGATGPDPSALLMQYLEHQDIPLPFLRRWLDALPGGKFLGSIEDINIAGLPPLDEYQSYTVANMSTAGGVMSLGIGLGKTYSALYAAITAKRKLGLASRCWIATSLNAFSAWQPFLALLKEHFDDVQIVSIDSLFKIVPLTAPLGGVIIFDEAHLLGGATSRRGKNALLLRLRFEYGLSLTGTLLHCGLPRSLPTLNLAVPGMASFSTPWNAAATYHCIEHRRFKVGERTQVKPHIVRPQGENAKAFAEFLAGRYVVSLSRTSPLVQRSLVIPEQALRSVISCVPWKTQYEDSVAVIRRIIATEARIPNAPEVLHRLARSGIEEKTAWLLDFIEPGQQYVVFAKYHDTLDATRAALDSAGILFTYVDGSVSADLRTEAQRRFRAGEVSVFLGQVEAAGVSLNLQCAHTSVAIDCTWRPDFYDQALGRTCRRGQEHECTHYDLVANVLQQAIITRVREGQAFDASVSAYQDTQRALEEIACLPQTLITQKS